MQPLPKVSSGIAGTATGSQWQSAVESIKNQLVKEKGLDKASGQKLLEEAFIQVSQLNPISKSEKAEYNQLLVSILGRYGILTYPDFNDAAKFLQASL